MYRPTQLKKIWLRDLTRARVRKISRAKSAVIHFDTADTAAVKNL